MSTVGIMAAALSGAIIGTLLVVVPHDALIGIGLLLGVPFVAVILQSLFLWAVETFAS